MAVSGSVAAASAGVTEGACVAEKAREGGVEARALLPTAEEGDEEQDQSGVRDDEGHGEPAPFSSHDDNGDGGDGGEGVGGGPAVEADAGTGTGCVPEEDAGEAVGNPGREASYGTVSSAMFMSGATDGARWVHACVYAMTPPCEVMSNFSIEFARGGSLRTMVVFLVWSARACCR